LKCHTNMNGKDPEETECKKKDAFCGWVQDNNKLTRLACMPKVLEYESSKIEYEVGCEKDPQQKITTCLCNTDNCNYQCNENDEPNCKAPPVVSTRLPKVTETSGSATKGNVDVTSKPTATQENTNGAMPADDGSTKSKGKVPIKEKPMATESSSGRQRIAEPCQIVLIIWILATFVTSFEI